MKRGELQQWIAVNRDFRAWQERLRATMLQWEETKRDEGALLQGAALANAFEKFKERREELSQAEQDFIQQSIKRREKLKRELEEQQKRELEAARQLAQASEARRKAEEEARQQAEKRAEQEAKALAEREHLLQLETLARTEAEKAKRDRDEFFVVLSHELRTPITTIVGWSRLLLAEKHRLSNAQSTRALESIERSAKYQLQLIEELLDMSYILQGRLKLNVSLVNLATIISVTLETLDSTAQDKEIQIQTVFEPNIEQVAGDVSRLRQIVWNLLSNAIKFTPKGGQVKVHLCCVDSMAQIRVSDTGIGISSEVLSHIFDDFRPQHGSTTRSLGGLKLGLAIARNLIELHGGTITAESPGIDQGATFTVRLPFKTNSPLIGK